MYKGKFAIIKFIPNPIRDESINIGLILHIPEIEFLIIKYNRDDIESKLQRLAPKLDNTLIFYLIHQLNNNIESLSEEENREDDLLEKLQKDFNKFVVIEKPRKILIQNIQTDSELLFKEFINNSYRIEMDENLIEKLLDHTGKAIVNYNFNETIPIVFERKKESISKTFEQFIQADLLETVSNIVFSNNKYSNRGLEKCSLYSKIGEECPDRSNFVFVDNIQNRYFQNSLEYTIESEDKVKWTSL